MVDSVQSNPIGSTTSLQNIQRSYIKRKKDNRFRKLNIGLVGNASVGKTSLIRRFVKGEDCDSRSTVTTIGVERTPLQVSIFDEPIDVIMWDPAGQEHYRQITKNYFNQVDAIVLVFDMTAADTFEGVLRWYRQIRDCKDCPIVIVGNKCDLEETTCITQSELQEVSQMCSIETFQTSAVSGFNVDQCFFTII